MKKYIVFILCFLICCGQLSAQGRIDKVIDSMEGKPDVETTYTERRSPKKKKLMMTSRIFNFENTFYFEKLRKAFEEERSNSISAVKTNKQMTYRFDDDKGVSTYTLSWNSDRGPFTMVMTWRSSDSKDSSYLMGDDMLDFGNGEFPMDVEELRKRLEGNYKDCSDIGDIVVRTVDSFGCPISMTYSSSDGNFILVKSDKKLSGDCSKAQQNAAKARKQAQIARQEAAKARAEAQKQAAKARQEAAKARIEAQKQAAKARQEATRARAEARRQAAVARQNAAKARQQAAQAQAEMRRQTAKARAEARRSAAKARRDAAHARRVAGDACSGRSEKIYDLASRSRCRIVSSAGVVTEMSALDALDNDIVWAALEDAVDSGNNKITTTTISGSTTTVIIEPEPEKI